MTDKQRAEIVTDESLSKYLNGGMCTGIVAPYGLYLAGPLSEGEDMAVAEIDLSSIVRQKNILDTVGHYSRPDILRLGIDRSERNVVVDMKPKFDDLEDTHLAVLLRDSDSMDKKE